MIAPAFLRSHSRLDNALEIGRDCFMQQERRAKGMADIVDAVDLGLPYKRRSISRVTTKVAK